MNDFSGLYTAARSPESPGCNQICRGCNLDRTGLVRLVGLVGLVRVVRRTPSSRILQKKIPTRFARTFHQKKYGMNEAHSANPAKKTRFVSRQRNIYMICWENNVEHNISHRVRTYYGLMR